MSEHETIISWTSLSFHSLLVGKQTHSLSRAHVKVCNLLQNFGNFLRKKLFLSDKKKVRRSSFVRLWLVPTPYWKHARIVSLSLSFALSLYPAIASFSISSSISFSLSIYLSLLFLSCHLYLSFPLTLTLSLSHSGHLYLSFPLSLSLSLYISITSFSLSSSVFFSFFLYFSVIPFSFSLSLLGWKKISCTNKYNMHIYSV